MNIEIEKTLLNNGRAVGFLVNCGGKHTLVMGDDLKQLIPNWKPGENYTNAVYNIFRQSQLDNVIKNWAEKVKNKSNGAIRECRTKHWSNECASYKFNVDFKIAYRHKDGIESVTRYISKEFDMARSNGDIPCGISTNKIEFDGVDHIIIKCDGYLGINHSKLLLNHGIFEFTRVYVNENKIRFSMITDNQDRKYLLDGMTTERAMRIRFRQNMDMVKIGKVLDSGGAPNIKVINYPIKSFNELCNESKWWIFDDIQPIAGEFGITALNNMTGKADKNRR